MLTDLLYSRNKFNTKQKHFLSKIILKKESPILFLYGCLAFCNETPRRRAAGYPDGIYLLIHPKGRGIRPM